MHNSASKTMAPRQISGTTAHAPQAATPRGRRLFATCAARVGMAWVWMAWVGSLTFGLGPAMAFELPARAQPSAALAPEQTHLLVPTGPYQNGELPAISGTGWVVAQAFKVPSSSATTFQLLTPLREQLSQDGYEVLFECATDTCGGYDFRYAIKVLGEPDMHVDLGDFRFISAKRDHAEGTEHVTLLVSRTPNTGFLQINQVGPKAALGANLTASTKSPDTEALAHSLIQAHPDAAARVELGLDAEVSRGLVPFASLPLEQELDTRGYVVLDDLTFAIGSSQLDGGDFGSLRSLASYLIAHPKHKVTLVGHTDNEGALSANVALSRKRAQAVAAHLTGALGVPTDQVSFDGVGFLSPIANNLTDDGRAQNRRVEVVLTTLD